MRVRVGRPVGEGGLVGGSSSEFLFAVDVSTALNTGRASLSCVTGLA